MNRSHSVSFDEGLLIIGTKYAIGTNDGKEFRKVTYQGTKLMNGKPMMIFTTEENLQLSVNPSFHTYVMQEVDADYEVIT
jgi:hypothetical protein